MKMLIWNVRGINKWLKQKELKKILSSLHIQIAGLVETKVKEHNVGKVLKHLAPGWLSFHNYEYANNGRVWAIWNDREVGAHFIHCQVISRVESICALTVVYGFNGIEQRRILWEETKSLSQGTIMPWIIGGDFNAIFSPQDRLCGNPATSAEVQDFSE